MTAKSPAPIGAGLFVALLATVQLLADGAAGDLASPASIPRGIAVGLGQGPALAASARLLDGTTREVALGRLALARGDEATATRLLVDAGDEVATRASVDRIDAQGDYSRARALEGALVDRLERRGGNRTVRADALWRLGQLDAEVGYREPSHRRAQWYRALDDYRQALELEPLSVTTLLAAGNQALLLGERDAGAGYFRRALASDPSSLAARDGLARATR